MFLRLLTFFLLLTTVSAAKITGIDTSDIHVDATVGERLVIPCHFHTDSPIKDYQIELEWIMTPKEEDELHPIIRLDDTQFLPAKHRNARAKVHVLRVHKGDCSLIIRPAALQDSGLYRVRLALDGNEFTNDNYINVNVLQDNGVTQANVNYEEPEQDTAVTQPHTADSNAVKTLADKVSLGVMIGVLVVLAGLVLLLIAGFIFYGCYYYLRINKGKDAVKAMEEAQKWHPSDKCADMENFSIISEEDSVPWHELDARYLDVINIDMEDMLKDVISTRNASIEEGEKELPTSSKTTGEQAPTCMLKPDTRGFHSEKYLRGVHK